MANSNNPFQPGDIVQLKSGGSLMTVAYLESDKVHVIYADEKGFPIQRTVSIPAVVLKKVDAPAEPYTGALPLGGGPS